MTFKQQLIEYIDEYEAYLIDLDRKPAEMNLEGFIGWLEYYKVGK